MHTPHALLMLDDGTCFEGTALGACKETSGEIVFTTSLVGYLELLTDPASYGKIIVFAAAHVGNYGTHAMDCESGSFMAAGAVFHEVYTPKQDGPFPHWRAEQTFPQYLAQAEATAITGIDTRALVLHLRENGPRMAVISAIDLDKNSLLQKARALTCGGDLVQHVTCKEKHAPALPDCPVPGIEALVEYTAAETFEVAVLDFGASRSLLRSLEAWGIKVTLWPATAKAEAILASAPRGVVLSSGPGNPEACPYAANTVRELLGKTPVLGIGLGHQILCLALGAKAEKMPAGHHGHNHPVKDAATGQVISTHQNSNYSISRQALPGSLEITHWNLVDNTIAGVACTGQKAFSVQYHPESRPGSHRKYDVFNRFRALLA